MTTAFYVALKDLQSALRSRFFIGMAVFVPVLVTALFFLAFGGHAQQSKGPGMAPVRVAIVNLDKPGRQSLGRLVYTILTDPQMGGYIRGNELGDEAAARAALDRREADVAVIIPAGFSATVNGDSGQAVVRVLADPARRIGPAVVEGILQQALDGFSGARVAIATFERLGRAAGIRPDTNVVGRLARAYPQIAAAGLMRQAVTVRAPEADEDVSVLFRRIMADIFCGLMVFFVFYTGAYTAMSTVREGEDGTLARLFALPVPRSRIFGGKLLSVLLTVSAQALVLIMVSSFLFGLRWGSAPSSALAFLGMVAAASGFGVMLASFIKTTRQAGPVLGGGLSVAGMLGGLFTQAVPNMPVAFNRIALVLPQGWVMRAWSLALSGCGPAELALPLAVLFAMGAVCFGIGLSVFRRRFV
jgi:ABC-2 type transport system permease protein